MIGVRAFSRLAPACQVWSGVRFQFCTGSSGQSACLCLDAARQFRRTRLVCGARAAFSHSAVLSDVSDVNHQNNADNTQHDRPNVNDDPDLTSPDPTDDVRQVILRASMSQVNDLGWSRDAIVAGAETVGYSASVHGLFARGGAELAEWFVDDCNRKLVINMQQQHHSPLPPGDTTPPGDPPVSLQDRISEVLDARLRMLTPYITRWPEAMAIMARPTNVAHSLPLLATLVDDIWHHCADTSVNLDWYTKRAGLAAVYLCAELHLVADQSRDWQDTSVFVQQRVNNLLQVTCHSQHTSIQTQQLLSVAMTTVINVFGLQRR